MNILAFSLFAVGYFLVMYIVDSLSISRILTHFGHPNSLRDILPARALTYLLMVINYAASQAAFAFYEYRKRQVPISEMMGIFGIIAFLDLYLLATLAFLASLIEDWSITVFGLPVGTFIRLFTLCGYAFLLINIAFWNGWLNKIPILHYLAPLFDRLRNKPFFSVLKRSKPEDYLYTAIMRLPVHALILLSLYVVALTFRSHIPFINVAANTPLIFFIGSIPITPGGLGTTNAVLVELFKPYITSAAIANGLISAGDLLFAMSLMWMFANYLLKSSAGLIAIKFVSRALFEPTPNVSEETAES